MKNDIFSLNRSFYVSSHNFYKSSWGGILSILFLFIIIPVLYFISKDFIFGRNPIISKYQVNKLDTVNWDKKDIPILISYPRYLLNETILLEWDEESYKLLVSNMTECSEEQFNRFIKDSKNESMIYLCRNYNKFMRYYIQIIHCRNISNVPDFDSSNLTCGNGNKNYSFVNFYIPEIVSYIRYLKLNTSNFYEPVEIDDVITSNRSNLYLVMNWNKLVNDIGYFFKNEIINYFYSVSHRYEETIPKYFLFRMEIRLDWQYQIEKSYMKIQELTARLIAVIKLLFAIFSLINWNEYFYCKYFLSIYLNISDPKILMNKINQKLGITDEIPLHIHGVEIKNEIIKIYSFSSYLLSLIPFCSTKEVIKIRLILDEIKNFISMENYIEGYPQINNFELEERKGFYEGFLTKLDFLAKHKSFYIDSNDRFYTRFGVVFTYFYIICYIPILYFIGYDFWFKLNPNKNNYDYDNRDINNKPDNYSANIPMMIEVSKSFANYAELLQYNYNTLGYNRFDYHECSDGEYFSYNKTTPKRSDIKYICTNAGNLLGNYFKDGEIDTFISFVNCTSLEKYEINDYTCIKQPPKENEKIFFAVSSKVQYYTNSYNNYITNTIEYKEHSTIFNKNGRSWYVIKFTEKRIKNDFDLFFSNKTLEIIYESSTYQLISKESDIKMGNFFDIFIQMRSFHNNVEKVYLKFPDILSRVFGIMDILYAILFLVNIFCETFFFHSIFKDSFFKILDTDIIQNIINKSDKSIYDNLGNSSVLKNNISININNPVNKYQKVNKEELISLFTFSNYIYYKLFYCCLSRNSKMMKIKALYDEFKKFLFVENTFIFKNKIYNNDSIMLENVNKTERVLKKFDLLTFKGIIHINKNTVFKTTIGGIISVIYLIAMLGFFYLFGYDFFARKHPTIQIYQANYHEIDNYTNIWQIDVPIIIGYSKDLKNSTRYNNFNPYNRELELNYGIYECTDDIKNMPFYNSSHMYNCTNLNRLFGNHYQGYWTSTDLYYLACSKSQDRKCTQNPDPNKTYSIEFYLNTTYLNYETYDNYLEEEKFYSKKNNIFGLLLYGAFNFKQNIFYDDKGILFPEPKKEIFTSTYYKAVRTSNKGGLRLRLDFNENLVTIVSRTYIKLPQMLAEVFSLIFFLKFFIDMIYSLISDYLYEQYFLKKFFERINILSLTNNINNRVFKNEGDYIELDVLSDIQINLYIKEYFNIMNFKNYFKFNYLYLFFKDSDDLIRYEVILKEYKKFLSLEKVIMFDKSNIKKDQLTLKNYSNLNASENLNLNAGIELKINKINFQNNQ